MIGLALALIVVGVGLFFLVPFVGIPIGAVGLLLAVLYLVGFGRRAAEGTQPYTAHRPLAALDSRPRWLFVTV